jgi:hypothetical protein
LRKKQVFKVSENEESTLVWKKEVDGEGTREEAID